MYKTRIKIFLGLIGLVLVVMLARLGHLQIIRGEYYRRQARQLLRETRFTPARRGRILDRTGRYILAEDQPCFDFCLEYRFITSDADWVKRQKRIIARREHVTADRAGQIYRQRAGRTWEMARDIAEEAGVDLDESVADIRRRVEAIRRIVGMEVREERTYHPVVRGLDERMEPDGTVGAKFQPSLQRRYPFGRIACHVLGATGQVSREEMDRHNIPQDEAAWLKRMQVNYLPGDTIGKSGVEKACEKILRARRGYRLLRSNGPGRQPDVLAEVPPKEGDDVHLTIDVRLQQRLTEVLKSSGHNGAIVAVTVPHGEILALVSVPTYDLNEYQKQFDSLIKDSVNHPLQNRAVAACFPPGSTMKPFAAVAALEEGVINMNTTFNCKGYLHNPNAFRCWIWKYNRGHGPLSVVEAIKHSCNVFFYNVGQRLGPTRLGNWYRKFGFGEECGTGLVQERTGIVPTKQWLRRRYGRSFRVGDSRLLAIGQGLITTTPLHLATAMAALARGQHLSPLLIIEHSGDQRRRRLDAAESHLRAAREGMYRVVNSPGGTAYKIFHGGGVEPPGVEICGKTGTAETAPLRVDSDGDGRITAADKIVRRGKTAWFAGFAPHGEPKIAFAVMVEYVTEGGGGQNAGPLARQLVKICRELGYVK